jgi:hypothetical protein
MSATFAKNLERHSGETAQDLFKTVSSWRSLKPIGLGIIAVVVGTLLGVAYWFDPLRHPQLLVLPFFSLAASVII